MINRVFTLFTGIDPKRALWIAAVTAVLAALLIGYGCARQGGREVEAIETREETAQTVDELEKTYEQIDENRADADDGDIVERLRDGSFLTGGTGSEAPLPAD